MTQDQLEELLRSYRTVKARYAYLRTQLEMLERFLRKCEESMVDDCVSMSQAITGMPHGSTVGDPTSRLAIDIASGKASEFVKQIREDIEEVRIELAAQEEKLMRMEIILGAMTDRERQIVEMKIVADLSWTEILAEMNAKYNNSYSKRSLQRLYSRAMEKAEEVAR